MSDPRDKLASDFQQIARELVEAAKHAEIAAKHFSDKDIPRACAHSTAIQGHSLAKSKAARQDLKIDFHLGDLRLFDLGKKFDFIFCGFNSSQHLHEEKEFRSFLEAVKKHLTPSGVFVFDIFNPSIAMLNRNSSEKYLVSKYADPDDQREISVWEYPSYDSTKQLSSFRFLYEKNGQTLFEEKFSLRNYFPLEMDVLLRNCGIDVTAKFGGYQKQEFSSQSMKQIFVCRTLE